MRAVTFLFILCFSVCYIHCKDLILGDSNGLVLLNQIEDFYRIPFIKRDQEVEVKTPNVKTIKFVQAIDFK